jgi:hypothetical protein
MITIFECLSIFKPLFSGEVDFSTKKDAFSCLADAVVNFRQIHSKKQFFNSSFQAAIAK